MNQAAKGKHNDTIYPLKLLSTLVMHNHTVFTIVTSYCLSYYCCKYDLTVVSSVQYYKF